MIEANEMKKTIIDKFGWEWEEAIEEEMLDAVRGKYRFTESEGAEYSIIDEDVNNFYLDYDDIKKIIEAWEVRYRMEAGY